MRLFPALAAILTLSPAIANVSNPARLPLSFEPNLGQADAGAKYLARGAGYLLTLSPSGASMMLRSGTRTAQVASHLAGSNTSPTMEALDPLPGHSSYFRGKDSSKWITNLPNFARVRAGQVYPGIDLIYYGNQSLLEYDFLVSPGADPHAIKMHFDGITGLHTDTLGNLVLVTTAGDVTQNKPVAYQTIAGIRKPVDARFVIGKRHEVSFRLGAFDASSPLVIDPSLFFSSFLGGAGLDEGHSVASDQQGYMYMTGVTFSTPGGDADVLVRKITPDGTSFAYIADIGGSDNDYGNGIAVDVNGSAYIGGRTRSLDFPVANAFQSTNYGVNNAFVTRLDPTGTLLYFSTYIGGTSDDRGYALALDNQGSVYLTGAASSPDFPTNSTAYQRSLRGGLDCFVFKLDYQGNAIFSTYIGGGSDDQAFAIAVDINGNSYITGQTLSDSYPQVNPPFQHSRHGGLDAFVTELSADGTGLVYSTFIGGGGDDSGGGIAVDNQGNSFVVGTTSSTDFPTTNGAFQTGYGGGNSDAFVAGYSPSGQFLLFATYLGSHGTDDGNAIALDGASNIYITGDTNSDQFPVTQDATQPFRAGGFDAILSVLDRTGTQLLFSTFYGGSGNDSGYGIALDPNVNVFLTGATSSGDLPISAGAVQGQAGGGASDAFLAKISFNGPNGLQFVAPPATTSANPVSAFGRGMAAGVKPQGHFSPREPRNETEVKSAITR